MEGPRNNIDDSLLARYLDGSTTDQESAMVEAWINNSTENQRFFDQFIKIWEKSKEVAYTPDIKFNKKAAFENVLSRIEEGTPNKKEGSKSGKVIALNSWFTRVAAILIIGIGIYIMYQFLMPSDSTILMTAENEHALIVLPDNSTINLNRGGKIKYAENFKDNRKVSLNGEAFFEVESQKESPFIIELSELEVMVIGTSFYITALENEDFIEVGVKTGIVEVKKTSNSNKITLTKSESIIYIKSSESFERPKKLDENKLFWKTSVLEFNNQPLNQVLSTLEKAYGKNIIFQNSEMENCYFTGRFKSAELEEIINQLALSFNFETTLGDEIIISGKACEE